MSSSKFGDDLANLFMKASSLYYTGAAMRTCRRKDCKSDSEVREFTVFGGVDTGLTVSLCEECRIAWLCDDTARTAIDRRDRAESRYHAYHAMLTATALDECAGAAMQRLSELRDEIAQANRMLLNRAVAFLEE